MAENNPSDFNAHYNPDADQYQSNFTHNSDTADIAIKKTPLSFLENIIWLMCLFHDAGKFTRLWQDYFQSRLSNPEYTFGAKEDHTTAGGQLIEELFQSSMVSELIQTAIYSHHGLQDCISPDDGASLYIKRREKAKKLPMEECREQFYRENNQTEITRRSLLAREEAAQLKGKIQGAMRSWGQQKLYGNRDFFLGMFERILTSLLIDADRRNTEDFMSGDDIAPLLSEEQLQKIWKDCCMHVEKKVSGFTDKSGINKYRAEISDACKELASKPGRLYRLTVSTGAGKTLSSLRFAVTHAQKFHKKRIIYVAPFHSIVEQNAEEIRNALGRRDIVLEHHCNIVMEDNWEQERYDRLTEDWQSPVIVTTAVQFLNTIFAGKTGNVRRMHSLCNSVIIMDEVQALPVEIVELFNMAINFLTEFVDATVVLCTATQPLLDALPQNRLRPPVDMIEQSELYREKLRRTEIVDCTNIKPGGLNIDEAAEFVLEKAEEYGKVLFIVNTKKCAELVFRRVKQLCGQSAAVSHLSTNMCPEHRSNTLKAIKSDLTDQNRRKTIQICISTQLIEAGVDISFCCVIRSLAGLDNLIQAAGRCNRNKETEKGMVFLVRLGAEAENVSSLRDICIAQEAMQSVLYQFRQNPERLDNRLDTAKANQMYYEIYFKLYIDHYGDPLSYPVTVKGVRTNIVNLLSGNPDFARENHRHQMLKQAFKTAGEEFEVITDSGTLTLIVPYGESVYTKLSELEQPYLPLNRKKQILRELQPYTVSVPQRIREKLGQAVHGIWNNRIWVLDERFYDKELGLIMEPKPMQDLQM